MARAIAAPPGNLAPLARRLGALAYEALLFVAMAFVAGFVFLPFVSPERRDTLTLPSHGARVAMLVVLVVAFAVYYGWCWSHGRRTLPQKTWRLRLVDRQGASLSWRRALGRYAAAWIAPALALTVYALLHSSAHARNLLAIALAGYAFALVDRDRQFLHDRIAGTYVVRDA
ncbi:MAG TPA: RDD family protein [Casimicrobiaceae bacterium]